MISAERIEAAAYEAMRSAAIDIPDDYRAGLARMRKTESSTLGCFVIDTMLDNYKLATDARRPMCADTGLPRYFVRVGNEARVDGGFVALENALRRATARATQDIPLRPNRVHPLSRADHDNNVGTLAPEIEYAFEPDGDWIDIITVHKGGLFGTDYRMLFPGDGLDGIRRFYLDTLVAFGKRGLACQPAIVGVGLGGSKDTAMVIGKQAACLRVVGSRHPEADVAALEVELEERGNSLGLGPMGFAGKSLVMACHVEVAYTHTGGLPMSVHCFCLSSRRAVVRVGADGGLAARTDPEWFSTYRRRDGVEWPLTEREAAQTSA